MARDDEDDNEATNRTFEFVAIAADAPASVGNIPDETYPVAFIPDIEEPRGFCMSRTTARRIGMALLRFASEGEVKS